MSTVYVLLIVRLTIGLFIGIYLTWKLKHILRTMVVRMIPHKHRFGDQSFNIQARWNTITAFIFIVAIACLVNYGISLTQRHLFGPQKTKTKSTKSDVDQFSFAPKQQWTEQILDQDTLPQEEVDTYISDTKPIQKPDQYYLQVQAFWSISLAEESYTRYRRRFGDQVHLGESLTSQVPFKVLLGPFESRKACTRFRLAKRLKGFPVDPVQMKIKLSQ